MKKIFTLTVLLALVLNVSAQYRKSWDFTKWSATTASNLRADANWTDDEKGDNYASKPPTADKCWWEAAASTTGVVQANGEDIPELTGMKYVNTKAKGLAIALDYPDCTERDGADFGPYHGAQYLWLCSKSNTYFVIPHVAPGTTIKMGVESHKFSSARGVTLYMGQDSNGTKIDDPVNADGTAVSGGNVKQYQDLTWTVPADATATNEDDGTVDVAIYCNSGGGCHIYYITVGDGDSPQVEDQKKIAYLYNGELESDYPYVFLSSDARFDVQAFNGMGFFGINISENFDAIVVSPTLAADGEMASSLKGLIAFIPVLNLNPALYETWGYGKAVKTDTPTLTVTDASNAIFEGLDTSAGLQFLAAGGITGVELGDYMKDDAILAKANDAVAIHAHNLGRNAYMLLPLASDDVASDDVYMTLIPQAVLAVSKTKRDITAVGTPVISFKQLDGASEVTITAANSKAIYYTLDGSDPTEESTLYTGPFTLTEGKTVKAFATGDGYIPSEIAEKEVLIATKAKTPTIAVAREAGKSVVTLATDDTAVDIYYNFAGQTSSTTASVKYSEPFELTTPATVTFFAVGDGVLNSDAGQQFVGIDGLDKSNIRWDVLAHFNANAENWQGKGQQTDASGAIINANYFFTWGKNAGEYLDSTSVKETVKTFDGLNDSIIYNPLPGESYEADGWVIKSVGQVMVFEKLNLGWNIGDTSMRNPDAAEDAIGVNDTEGITENALTFGKQPKNGPFNATLETVAKYAGPFDVVVYAGNGNDGQIPTMQVETSADGETWTKLGDVNYSLIKRNWKKTQLSYDGTDEVYVRVHHTDAKSSGQVYDVYVLNNGERSKQYDETKVNESLGITLQAAEGNIIRTEVYSLSGTRMGKAGKGVSIIKQYYNNGAVKTRKVVMK